MFVNKDVLMISKHIKNAIESKLTLKH